MYNTHLTVPIILTDKANSSWTGRLGGEGAQVDFPLIPLRPPFDFTCHFDFTPIELRRHFDFSSILRRHLGRT